MNELQRLRETFRTALDLPADADVDDLHYQDSDKWDSLGMKYELEDTPARAEAREIVRSRMGGDQSDRFAAVRIRLAQRQRSAPDLAARPFDLGEDNEPSRPDADDVSRAAAILDDADGPDQYAIDISDAAKRCGRPCRREWRRRCTAAQRQDRQGHEGFHWTDADPPLMHAE